MDVPENVTPGLYGLNDFGFIHCPWSKTCNADAKEYTYSNVRRYPTTRLRILEILDEIFEWLICY